MGTVFALPQNFIPANTLQKGISEFLTFVGITEKPKKHLSPTVGEVLKSATVLLDEILLTAIEHRSSKDFAEARTELIGGYFKASVAVSELLKVAVPKTSRKRLVNDVLAELEGSFRDQGLKRFGAAVQTQAIFTIWTLKKIDVVVEKILSCDVAVDERKDQELCENFLNYLMWSHFHMACLVAAIRFDRTIYPEVLSNITDGLRAMVDAYGWARQGLELRSPRQEPLLSQPTWDEEDQELLDSSMLELDSAADPDGY